MLHLGCCNSHRSASEDNKLMSFGVDVDKLLEKYKTIWTKIEDLQNIEFNALPVYDDRIR